MAFIFREIHTTLHYLKIMVISKKELIILNGYKLVFIKREAGKFCLQLLTGLKVCCEFHNFYLIFKHGTSHFLCPV